MSFRHRGKVILCPEPPRKCATCGKRRECRPYGPNGTDICFKCAMADEPGTRKRMNRVLYGKTEQ